MTQKRDDKDDHVTAGACKENRAITRYWLSGIGTVAMAVGLLVIVPATLAGYRAQINLDLHIARQKSFEALILEKVKTVGTKVESIGSEVDDIGTEVKVIGAEVAIIGAKVDSFGNRFDTIETKFDTSWGHASENRKSNKVILELLQKLNTSTE